MADDNMLQNLFCHKNLFKIIASQEDYQLKFLNRKLNAKERQDKEEYIKFQKDYLITNIAKNLKEFWVDIFKNNKTLPKKQMIARQVYIIKDKKEPVSFLNVRPITI